MNKSDERVIPSVVQIVCPYCSIEMDIEAPKDYAPFYVPCTSCDKKFIVEKRAHRIDTLKVENAPCCSDPDCQAIEMGGSDEQ